MRLHRASREYASLTVTADVDLTAATLTVSIDGGVYTEWPWTDAPVGTAGAWTRTGRRLLAGPYAEPGIALVLASGQHTVTWRLTGIDPEQPVRSADPIDVT